jgi:hypothetical protein
MAKAKYVTHIMGGNRGNMAKNRRGEGAEGVAETGMASHDVTLFSIDWAIAGVTVKMDCQKVGFHPAFSVGWR